MRLTAKKVRICDIISGKFFYSNKESMVPSYVISKLGEKFSRVNIVGTITDKFLSEDGNYGSLTVDDGTEDIRLKVFSEGVALIDNIEIGDIILTIGKVKEYSGERYINCEIVRKVDANYESLRKLELVQNIQKQKSLVESVKKEIQSMSKDEIKEKYEIDDDVLQVIQESEVDYKPKLLEIIESLDEGDGVEVSKIFGIVSLPENMVEKTLDELISEGYVYEPRPGKIKKI